MAKALKLVGLLALLHHYNAATLRCLSAPLFAIVGKTISGQCTLEDPEDVTKLTIIQDSITDVSTRDILPYTHYTLPYPNTTATQDYIHFQCDEKARQAYTHYITPKRDVVTICSPFECIYLSGVNTHFYITPGNDMPREECPENQYINAFQTTGITNIVGGCVTLNYPKKKSYVIVKSSPSSFFYLSWEKANINYIIDHRSSPPVETVTTTAAHYRVGWFPTINLVRLSDYTGGYYSGTQPSEPPPLIGLTASFYLLKQKNNRRYMVQTHAALYSLLDNGQGSLTLELEEEDFYGDSEIRVIERRIVLQIFPDGFKLPSEGLPEAMRYSALYKEKDGYEQRRVNRTITGAYAFMRAVDYVNAIGGKLEGRMRKRYARFGASYVFSMTTYLRNVEKEKQRRKMVRLLKAYGNEDWDQVGQKEPFDDEYRITHAKSAEGGYAWYNAESDEGSEKDDNNAYDAEDDIDSESTEMGEERWQSKMRKVGRFILLALIVVAMIAIFVERKKPPVGQNKPSSTLLTNQGTEVV